MPSYLDVVFFANGPDFLFHFEFLVGDLFLVNEIDDAAGCGASVDNSLDGLPRPSVSHHHKVTVHPLQPGLEICHTFQDEVGAVPARLG